MKHTHSITLAAMLARHHPGGSAEASSTGPRLAFAGMVFFWRRRYKAQ